MAGSKRWVQDVLQIIGVRRDAARDVIKRSCLLGNKNGR
jgi:hypothetical protein